MLMPKLRPTINKVHRDVMCSNIPVNLVCNSLVEIPENTHTISGNILRDTHTSKYALNPLSRTQFQRHINIHTHQIDLQLESCDPCSSPSPLRTVFTQRISTFELLCIQHVRTKGDSALLSTSPSSMCVYVRYL